VAVSQRLRASQRIGLPREEPSIFAESARILGRLKPPSSNLDSSRRRPHSTLKMQSEPSQLLARNDALAAAWSLRSSTTSVRRRSEQRKAKASCSTADTMSHILDTSKCFVARRILFEFSTIEMSIIRTTVNASKPVSAPHGFECRSWSVVSKSDSSHLRTPLHAPVRGASLAPRRCEGAVFVLASRTPAM
jgi:hypothetical protein